MEAGKTDLGLVIGQMSSKFFPFHPKPKKPNVWPWISSILAILLTAIPPLFFTGEGAVIAGSSAGIFVQGGISTIQPFENDPK